MGWPLRHRFVMSLARPMQALKGAMSILVAEPIRRSSSPSPRWRLVLAIAPLFAVGCKDANTATNAVPPSVAGQATERRVPTEESISEHMGAHAENATAMRDAVALANLHDLVEPGQWMAEHLADTRAPSAWRPYLEAFRLPAQEATAATTYEAAANAIGSMGAACAACHEKLGGPKPNFESPPPENERMQRHLYAVDLLWDGLVAPSDKAWKEGAALLADAPMTQEEIDRTAKESAPRETKALASAIRSLSAKAQAAPKETRGSVYGEILAGCSDCHAMIGQDNESP